MTSDDLIGSVEAARIIGKSPRTIHRLARDGVLPIAHTAPGGRVGTYLFRRTDIHAYRDELDQQVPA